MQSLKGRVAVVTGGGGGIGEGIAQACAAAGMKLLVADIESGSAERVAKTIRDAGSEAIGVGCDVTKRSEVEALADRAWSEFGGAQLLCNNAGVLVQGEILESTEKDWDWIFGVNVRGVMNGCWSFAPRMREQGGGHIVNTASVAGLTPLEGHGVYAASKHAVVALSGVLRGELANDNVGVSVLCPGGVATRITESQRNRHEAFGGPIQEEGPSALEQAAAEDVELTGLQEVLTPLQVGKLVVQAVEANDPYVATHPAWKDVVGATQASVAASFDLCAVRRG